jgi:hypothetical protein
MDPTFKPVCIGADLSSREVRPGGQIAVSLRFRNDGSAPAKVDYQVFTHVEYRDRDCGQMRIQHDHAPTVPTTAWEPGETINDGAYVLTFPEELPEGTYHLHVGVYAYRNQSIPRLSDQYVADIEVTPNAPRTVAGPPRMSTAEAKLRTTILAGTIHDALEIENARIAFRVSRQNGAWVLTDKSTGEVWYSGMSRDAFADVTFSSGEESVTRSVRSFADVRREGRGISLVYDPKLPGTPSVRFLVELLPKNQGLRFSYSQIRNPQSEIPDAWTVSRVCMLNHGLWATDTEHGYLAFPYRLGIMVPAWEGLPSTTLYQSYSNSSSYDMAMFGVVKHGSALLVHWDDPYVEVTIQRSWIDEPSVPGHSMVSTSIILSRTAKSFVVRPLGKGGYAEIAHAYREVARKQGLLRTWAEKIKANPAVESILGAADFKPFVFNRVHPHTKWNPSDVETTRVNHTFDDAAQIAEHLRGAVGIDKAMFVLAGWINRGYDNRHPDILPAASECGGNEGLADCSRRVKALGYLFGLHDNYQDMYRDAPSWDESYIMRLRDGSLHGGGVWAGGQAYLTCSKRAIELAKREQNLPSVKKLFDPGIYFIDTTFAAPPFECFSKEHPLTLNDDLHWKRELCEYVRGMFGLFGSEEGQEWAVPCADYFEGLMSHRTEPHPGQIIIPLFEMVYGDCINLYSHQADRATPDRPDYVLDHILYAEMPVYHFGPHTYFRQQTARVQAEPSVHWFKQIGPRRFEITYEWRVKAGVDKDYIRFVHFVKPDSAEVEQPIFQQDDAPARPTSTWKPGETILDGPYTVDVPEHVDGRFGILIGMWDGNHRAELIGNERTNLRYQVGTLVVTSGNIALKPASEFDNILCFARHDGLGSLNQTDRFIRNTYEVLSPLNRITAHTPMTGHEFLTTDRKVERTHFGDVEITVNYGGIPYRMDHAVLPRYGFLIESPTFVAFHAIEYAGVRFSEPTMLTARSMDGKPLSKSGDVKLYPAFGDHKVKIAGRDFTAR